MLITIDVKLPFKIKKDDGWYISSCPILDIHSQGKTVKKAKENLYEALFLFFVSCFERNTLAEVLRESGFSPQQTMSRTPKKVNKSKYLDINIPFINAKTPQAVCHA